MVAVAAEANLGWPARLGRFQAGWVIARQGEIGRGADQMEASFRSLQERKERLYLTFLGTLVARTKLEMGRTEEALNFLEELQLLSVETHQQILCSRSPPPARRGAASAGPKKPPYRGRVSSGAAARARAGRACAGTSRCGRIGNPLGRERPYRAKARRSCVRCSTASPRAWRRRICERPRRCSMLWSRPHVAVDPLRADETDLTSGSGCCL